ncbi:DUF2244 domain-containing protein [Alteromonas sp. CYL-A6]|uniref:DUF2244 domain-containing protein n=1 Tax=Alteromonas nitratireducens TaxID=3390813 RepID=UPI0034A77157
MVRVESDNACTCIILHPNRSATWRDTKLLLTAMAVFVGVIAVGWLFVGVWMILPFAGFEVGLLALLMYRVSRYTYRSQHIQICPQSVHVTTHHRIPALQFQRPSCHIEFDDPAHDWHLPVIRIVDGPKIVEVGEFLNLDDRQQLKYELEQLGLIVCRRHWWKRH